MTDNDKGKCEETCVNPESCFESNCYTLIDYSGAQTDQCYCPDGYRECRKARNMGYHNCIKIDSDCTDKG